MESCPHSPPGTMLFSFVMANCSAYAHSIVSQPETETMTMASISLQFWNFSIVYIITGLSKTFRNCLGIFCFILVPVPPAIINATFIFLTHSLRHIMGNAFFFPRKRHIVSVYLLQIVVIPARNPHFHIFKIGQNSRFPPVFRINIMQAVLPVIIRYICAVPIIIFLCQSHILPHMAFPAGKLQRHLSYKINKPIGKKRTPWFRTKQCVFIAQPIAHSPEKNTFAMHQTAHPI